MSRYPFEEYANRFLDSVKEFYAPITWKGLQRRYRRINHDLIDLQRDSDLSSTSPNRMTSDDIRIYLSWRRSLGYSNKEYAHEVNALTILFDFVGNPAVRQCMSRYPLTRPVGTDPRHGSLSKADRCRLIAGMDSYSDSDDFSMVRSYAVVAFLLGAGLRSKELRLLNLDDLDTESWILTVVHVKGEDSYGHSRIVLIAPEFHPIIENYLRLRSSNVIDSKAMFAPVVTNETGYLSSNSILRILSICEKDCGVSCDTRTFRRSYGQDLLDRGIDSIESVSVLMGHSSTRTTERYYARRKNDSAIIAARAVYSGSEADDRGCADSNAFESEHDGKDSQSDAKTEKECWRPDSNRRTPTRKDLESFAFDQAWQLQLERMMLKGLDKRYRRPSRQSGDFSAVAVDIERVFMLRDYASFGLDQCGVPIENTATEETADMLFSIGEIAASSAERKTVEFLLDVIDELLLLRIGKRTITDEANDISPLSIDNISLSICSKRLDSDGHTRFDLLRLPRSVAGDGHARMKIPYVYLVTAEILNGDEAVTIDAHLHRPSDLSQRDTVAYEFGNGVPCPFGCFDEIGISASTDFNGACGISYKSVQHTSAIDLNNITQLEA